jgi:hypothetical protein
MTTLKISDLSVGDWVRYRDREWEVCSIYQFTGEVGLFRKDSQICESIEDIDPIPITAEILEKNGFMLLSDSFSTYEYATLLGKMLRSTRVYLDAPQSISVSLQDTTIERGFYHREKTSVSILRDDLYVHDLQHALRLAGVDKEINL